MALIGTFFSARSDKWIVSMLINDNPLIFQFIALSICENC